MFLLVPHLHDIRMLLFAIQVDILTVEGGDEGVALHELVIQVGQGMRSHFIYYDAELETQAGYVDGSTLDINAIDVVANDFALQGCIIANHWLTVIVLCPGINQGSQPYKLIEQAHEEGS